MEKLDKLLTDLSERPISFKNIEAELYGVHLSDDMVVETDETMVLIDYKFKGFIENEIDGDISWVINVDVKNQYGEILDYKVKNQEILKARVYDLLIKIVLMENIFKIINK